MMKLHQTKPYAIPKMKLVSVAMQVLVSRMVSVFVPPRIIIGGRVPTALEVRPMSYILHEYVFIRSFTL